ncbi:MAG: amidohydrolase family protein, partial [Bacteroidota bacterium]
MDLSVLRTGKLYTSEEVIEDGAIVYDSRKILSVGRFTDLDLPSDISITEFSSCSAAPGLIDLHVHGAAGADFMDATDEAFDSITKWHARGGTTAMLATTCAAPLLEIFHAVEKAGDWNEKQNNGAKILGVHAEGPFFNVDMRGCHLPEYIISPDENAVTTFLEYRKIIKHITIAPELAGASKAIERFAADDISVSAAHSNAEQQTVERAIESGLGHVTHLFNAMSYYHKKG